MSIVTNINHVLSIVSKPIINKKYNDDSFLCTLNNRFLLDGYVKLPDFLTEDVFSIIDEEIKLIFQGGSRKDFLMEEYKTPRNLSVVGGDEILKCSSILPNIYGNHELRTKLSKIIGKEIFGVYHKHEFMVSNCLEHKGDTHGWHLDDPRYALIIILEGPPSSAGGTVEYIKNWNEFCKNNELDPFVNLKEGIEFAKRKSLISEAGHSTGECYLLNAGKNLHRVTPLKNTLYKRRVLNMAFDDRKIISFGKTADKLYGMASEIEGSYE